jgi:hypothetical protein
MIASVYMFSHMYVFIPTCALFLAYEVLPNIPMESDSIPMSHGLSKIDRENSILAIQTHQEILESVPLGSPQYSDEESD